MDERLAKQMEELGRQIGQRETSHSAALAAARARTAELHAQVVHAMARFNAAAKEAGAAQLEITVSDVRPDDKHLRSYEFDLYRGRHRAIVTVKSRAEVTLVGPFRSGKAEGPCRSFPLERSAEFDTALGVFLSAFAEDAATP